MITHTPNLPVHSDFVGLDYGGGLRTDYCQCGHIKGTHTPQGECCQGVTGAECPCIHFRLSRPEKPTVPSEPSINKKGSSRMTKTPKYKLSDGREYLSRKLGGYDDDVAGLRDLASKGKHVLLLGEPGCGKTMLLQAAHPNAENEIGHPKLTAWDMLWRPRPLPDGTIVYDPAPLTRAAMGGHAFYMDEIMRCSDEALTPLFSAMDGRGFIVGGNLDGTDLPVKKGFTVIGASNPLVRGAFLPDAIASRFHILTVDTSEELLVALGLDERLLVAWRNLSTMDGGDNWRPSIRELLSAQDFIKDGNMQQAAYALTGWRVPARDRVTVAGVIAPLLGVRVGEMGGVVK